MAQIIISSPDDREQQLRKMQGRMWCEEEIIQHLSIYKQPRLPKSPPQLAKGLYIMLVPGNYQEKHRQNCGRPHLSKLGLQHHQWTQVGDKNMTQLTETVLGKEKKNSSNRFPIKLQSQSQTMNATENLIKSRRTCSAEQSGVEGSFICGRWLMSRWTLSRRISGRTSPSPVKKVGQDSSLIQKTAAEWAKRGKQNRGTTIQLLDETDNGQVLPIYLKP